MPIDVAAALDADIAELEAALAADPRFRKLNDLKRARAWYEAPSSEDKNSTPSHKDGSSGFVSRPPLRRQSPERTRTLELAALYVRNRVAPVPTTDILDHLVSMGVEIGGAVPRNNLSAMLSNSDLFVSDGRRGWRLSELADNHSVDHDEAELGFDEICTEFFLKLNSGEMFRAREYVEANARLPEEMGDQLLVAAEGHANRDLDESEMKSLQAYAIQTIEAMT